MSSTSVPDAHPATPRDRPPRASRRAALAAAAGLVAALAGCATTTTSVLVGTARPPIPPDQVKVYLKPPRKYDQVALLEADSRGGWAFSDQAKMDVVVQRLKAEAARLGANGVLLQDTGNEVVGSVGTGVGNASFSGGGFFGLGVSTSVPIVQKIGHALAIFVIEE